VDEPNIDSDVLNIVKARRPVSFSERFNCALRCLGESISQLGEHKDLGVANAFQFMAETESGNLAELTELFRLLQQAGYVEGAFHLGGGGAFRPTVKGWEELDKLKRPRTDSSQAFVAMWFSDETNDAFINGIWPALTETGYKAMRIDKKDHNNKIDDEIIAEIRRSRFIVADFTCGPGNPRGGVYFEAGFALGLNIPVVWTCRDSSLKDVHFDTRQYAHIVWKNSEDLRIQLRNRIGATIGIGPLSQQI
jgi:hypothetical protein